MRISKRLAHLLSLETPFRELIRLSVLWTILVIVVAVEAYLIRRLVAESTVPRTGSLQYFAVLLALLLVAASVFYRLPVGRKRLSTHYVVRPVISGITPPPFDLEAITSLLKRELTFWQSRANDGSAQVSSIATLSVAHITLPVEWIWTTLRRYITGKHSVIIETSLTETGALESWARRPGRSPSVVIEPIREDGSIEGPIQRLALALIADIDPELGADLKWQMQDYGGALRLYKLRPRSFGRDLAIARIFVESGKDRRAEQQLRAIEEHYLLWSWRRSIEYTLLKAGFYVSTGKNEAAKDIIEPLITSMRFELGLMRRSELRQIYRLLGDSERDVGRPDRAREFYDQTEALLLAELGKAVGLRNCSDFDECLERTVVSTAASLEVLLAEYDDLIGAKATCYELLGSSPEPEYERLLKLLNVREEVSSSWYILVRRAQVQKYAASAIRRYLQSEDWAKEQFAASLQSYGIAIERSAAIYPPLDVDHGVNTQVAWCDCGRLQCQRAIYSIEGAPPLTSESADALLNLQELINMLNQQDIRSYARLWRRFSIARENQSPASGEILNEVAIFLTHALLRLPDSGPVDNLISQYEQVAPVEAMPLNQEQLQRLLGRFDATNAPNREDAESLLKAVGAMLGTLRDVSDAQLIRLDEEGLKRQCVDRFADVDAYHPAEGVYGMACFYAILSEHGEDTDGQFSGLTLRYLEEAIKVSRTFIGRARNDPDFYHLRGRSEFRQLLELPTLEPDGHGATEEPYEFESEVCLSALAEAAGPRSG